MNNIDKFYIDDNKINQKFYKGKTLIYFLNNESDDFNINNIFSINGKEYLDFNLDTVSLEIISIQNKKGKIYNGNEELFEGSFFKSKNIYLTHKKINDEGYLTIITIKTKPRNRQLSVYTCETEAKIYLYVAQKNCTINEASDNFCQKCIEQWKQKGGGCPFRCNSFKFIKVKEKNRKISSLKFKCIKGCGAEIPYNEIENHYKTECFKRKKTMTLLSKDEVIKYRNKSKKDIVYFTRKNI
jgi:hypothetical protein